MKIRFSAKPLVAAAALGLGLAPSSPPWPEVAAGSIVTVAGGQPLAASYPPEAIAFYGAAGLVAAPDGAVYVLDKGRSTIFRIEPGAAAVRPHAGTLTAGFDGDGRAASETSFHVPSGLALDPRTGELLVADTHNHRVRAIAPDGASVRTLAGVGIRGVPPDQLATEFPTFEGFAAGRFSGDGGPAAEAELNLPAGIAADGSGVVFVADSGNHRIRAVNRGAAPVTVAGTAIGPGEIRTLAGDGTLGFAGDGGPAAAARLAYPAELEVDAAGNLLVVDTFNQRIRRIDRQTGVIDTVVRGGLELEPAEAAARWAVSIMGLGVTAAGEIVYADRTDRSIHAWSRDGGDRVLYTAASREAGLGSVAVGPGGEVFAADVYHNRVLRVAAGAATTLAGGAPAPRRAPLDRATFSVLGPVSVDERGAIYLADVFHYAVRRIVPGERSGERMVETFLGSGALGSGGDGGPPDAAELVHPTDVLIDGDRAVYVSDQYANRVRRVSFGDAGPRVGTLAGHLPGADGRLGQPLALARHPRTGEIYVTSQETHGIRKVGPGGRLLPVAGTGQPGFSGDGGPALAASLNWPAALAFDRQGNLYVSDMLNHRIRRITPDGRIRTYAGNGAKGFSGDGGPAAEAALNYPGGLAFDAAGNLYFADSNNHRVRRVDAGPGHRVRTVAGTGRRGFSGDGGPAVEARLNVPRGVAFGPGGVLYIVDSFNRRLRAMRPS